MKELKLSIYLTIGLFVIGTIILVLFAISLSNEIITIGYIFTGISFTVCFALLIFLILKIATNNIDAKNGLKSIFILIINVPVAIFYIYLVFILMSYARITFENSTGQALNSIKILGCEDLAIDHLEINESKTIWINLPNDCQIDIEYELGGETKRETVVGYLTNFSAIKANYRIGSNEEIPI